MISCPAVPIKILWVCDVCGATGEVAAELPVERLEDLTTGVVAEVAIRARDSVKHPHTVRFAPDVSSGHPKRLEAIRAEVRAEKTSRSQPRRVSEKRIIKAGQV